jgi:UDP-N-acetylmuramyl pentapeptide phosphotransferase/UDP-N-acetylglucosamine-1-phosphate transferase
MAVAALLSLLLIWLLKPALHRYVLARPNARSSHKIPTPQGAGLAVVGATLLVASLGAQLYPMPSNGSVSSIFVAALLIAALGMLDDLKPIPVLPRLFGQAVAVGMVLLALPSDAQICPPCPIWLERGLLVVAGLWFVNLVNFMDGLDLMTAVETIPIAMIITLLGLIGETSSTSAWVAVCLGGAMIGFVPYNRPVASMFLGDVGSLPIGLLMGWCLLDLALNGHVIAAILLPLYYLSDTTVTLVRRLILGERVWVAHRTHFYQRATDNGLSVQQVTGAILTLNIFLGALAILTTSITSIVVDLTLLALGGVSVTLVMLYFSKSRSDL